MPRNPKGTGSGDKDKSKAVPGKAKETKTTQKAPDPRKTESPLIERYEKDKELD
ncbi:hypothetical protein SAMN05444166_0157 [Singulisphaera sp. GP187]|nr:hypothetical protein SAMN05444166_0157 [Singulisphaera sp. GP187]